MRITEKYLNDILRLIANRLNLAINKREAIEMGLKEYLDLDNNTAYGGYRIENVQVETGAKHGAFDGNGCEARLKPKEMLIKLRGILSGVNAMIDSNTKKNVLKNKQFGYMSSAMRYIKKYEKKHGEQKFVIERLDENCFEVINCMNQ